MMSHLNIRTSRPCLIILIDSEMVGAYRSDRSDMEVIINDLSEKPGRLPIKSYEIHTLSGNIWEEFAWWNPHVDDEFHLV